MEEFRKKVIITGSGQDSSYMVDFLLQSTSHDIVIAARANSRTDYSSIDSFLKNERVKLVTFDLNDGNGIRNLIKKEKPDYFLNFAAATFVKDSWDNPVLHMQVNAISLIHMLEAIKDYCPKCRFYSAGSSEQWGDVDYSPQDEKHPYKPRSIYGVSKVAADFICKVYRESYGLFALHGILLNHESILRTTCFVTRKITSEVARINKYIDSGHDLPSLKPLMVGNILSKRDWSHAEDFVRGVWLMVNQEIPKKYVLSSNETHSVKEFIDICFEKIGQKLTWYLDNKKTPDEEIFKLNEKDLVKLVAKNDNGLNLVKIDPQFFRPAEVDLLHGDSSLARKELGWKPRYSFNDLVTEMLMNDIKLLDV